MMKRKFFNGWVLLTLVLSGAMSFVSCESDDNSISDSKALNKSIVILYDNDVHCNIDGYTQMRGLRDAIVRSDTSYVGMVSSGDYLQGGLAGAISHGQFIVDIMKNMGYDAVTLGNHEFDYRMARLQELLSKMGTNIVCSNLFQYGESVPMYHPYIIKQYGNKRIAFVGVTTPETMDLEAYSFYDDERNQTYDLRTKECYTIVQQATDKARQEGADYVVVLAHLGEVNSDTGVDSHGLVAATRGIDAVLDGHTHSVIPCDWVENLDGKKIPVSQTGTKFANVGKLWISPDGQVRTSLVAKEDIPYENAAITRTTDSIKTLLKTVTDKKMATCDFDLNAMEGSEWTVRRQETSIGNLITDAHRALTGSQIAVMNGGGIRSNIKAGIISYGDVVNVQPNDNYVCVIEATGEEILNMLIKCTAKLPEQEGSFPQVSGMKYTIHTGSHTVTDVLVQDEGADTYSPLDLQTRYKVTINDYYANGGFYRTLQDCRLIETTSMLTRDALANYLFLGLSGVVPTKYKEPEGRITILND